MHIIKRQDANILHTPHGSEIRPLMDRTTSSITQCSLAEETLPPGKTVTPHHHEVLEEIYYILSGSGVMRIGDEAQAVGTGDAIYIPKHSVHSLTNTGEEDMKILLVCGPAFYFEDHRIVSTKPHEETQSS
ncbi:MAG TPA: cupin domain-containing protein [Blastocatellia bacterium]|nr:cupin domain-containing protein [Blastocatellia bacterium]